MGDKKSRDMRQGTGDKEQGARGKITGRNLRPHAGGLLNFLDMAFDELRIVI